MNDLLMKQFFGVDIGNSGLRVAELKLAERELGSMLKVNWCPENSSAIRHYTASSARYRPVDPAWLEELRQFIARTRVEPPADGRPALWLISSVRRDAQLLLTDYLQSIGVRFQVVGSEILPLEIDVQNPSRVGIDRLLAALAATELTDARPLVVIQAGSAVTVDLITRGSSANDSPLASFAGGAILPGVPMMLRLLGKGADMLPEIDVDELIDLPQLPGKNTEQAMICGAASALVGGVQHLINRYRAQYGQDLPVIISGGDGMRLAPYVVQPVLVESHLVHRGLLRLAELIGVKRDDERL